MFVNMDQTSVYFESKPKKTMHKAGTKAVLIRDSGSDTKRLTSCVSATSNGEKLLLSLIINNIPEGTVEKSIINFLPGKLFERW